MEYLLNLFYVYLFGCAFLTLCFGAEWAIDWWQEHVTIRDCVDEHAEKPNPL